MLESGVSIQKNFMWSHVIYVYRLIWKQFYGLDFSR